MSRTKQTWWDVARGNYSNEPIGSSQSPTPLEEGFVSKTLQNSLQTGPRELLSSFVDSIPVGVLFPLQLSSHLMGRGLHTQVRLTGCEQLTEKVMVLPRVHCVTGSVTYLE